VKVDWKGHEDLDIHHMHPYTLFLQWAKETTTLVCSGIYGRILPEAYATRDMKVNFPERFEVDEAMYNHWRGLMLQQMRAAVRNTAVFLKNI